MRKRKNRKQPPPNKTSKHKAFDVQICTVLSALPKSNQVYVQASTDTPFHAELLNNTIASYFGLNSSIFPEKGTSVLVLKTTLSSGSSTNYVLGSLVNSYEGASLYETHYLGVDKTYANCGLSDDDYDTVNDASNQKTSTGSYFNQLEGEKLWTTNTGVGLELRQNLAKLKGSELAFIETFLLDDFVRIMSKNFEHITGFGNYRITNVNNNLNVVWEGTKYEHETYGSETLNTDKGLKQGADNNIDIEDEDASKAYYDDGRWRFSQYIGKLGDLYNLYISDPRKNLFANSEIYKDVTFPTARQRLHVNSDGSILVQSVSDIIFEKVICIPMPYTDERLEEQFGIASDYLKALEQWKPSSDDESDIWADVSYNLQNYSKWFSQYYTLASFRINNYIVPNEIDVETPSTTLQDEQFESAQSDASLKTMEVGINTFATIKILKDGSITFYDAHGSSIHMVGGDINISATNNINLTSALGGIHLKAATDVTVLAKDNIELTAVTQGILLKSKLWFEALCTNGQMLLKSFFTKDTYTETLSAITNNDIKVSYKDRVSRNGSANSLILSVFGNIIIKADTYLNDASTYLNRAKNVLFNIMEGTGTFLVAKSIGIAKGVMKLFSPSIYASHIKADMFAQKTEKAVVTQTGEQYNLVGQISDNDNFNTDYTISDYYSNTFDTALLYNNDFTQNAFITNLYYRPESTYTNTTTYLNLTESNLYNLRVNGDNADLETFKFTDEIDANNAPYPGYNITYKYHVTDINMNEQQDTKAAILKTLNAGTKPSGIAKGIDFLTTKTED